MDDEKLGKLIASLGPDISWIDELPMPTPEEIRKRVANPSPAERAALEAEIVRIEMN
jgi:hypothetical protein